MRKSDGHQVNIGGTNSKVYSFMALIVLKDFGLFKVYLYLRFHGLVVKEVSYSDSE